LGLEPTGDVVLDTRTLGQVLAREIYHMKKLPHDAAESFVRVAWTGMRRRVGRKSWAHRLHVLQVRDLWADERWEWERLVGSVANILVGSDQLTNPSDVNLSELGLFGLLDIMGPSRPLRPPTTSEMLTAVGALPDRGYLRRPIYKKD